MARTLRIEHRSVVSAPARTATAAFSRRVIPQIFMRVRTFHLLEKRHKAYQRLAAGANAA